MSGEGDHVNASALYKDNDVWKDVSPIYQKDDEIVAVKIACSEQFEDAFAYLRAILQVNEMSERAFALTTDCIQQNPANYTLWQYRRELLNALKKPLDQELKFLDEVILETPKNYQVWHHRRAVVELLGNKAVSGELAFTDMILEDESKNYHGWQHRQWVIRHFSLFCDDELSFALKVLLLDPRNNSAWNYRYFILQGMEKLADTATLDIEFNVCERLIEKTPHNESIWNYLGGLLFEVGLTSRDDVVKFVEDLYERTEADKRSPYLVSFLCDILLERIEKKVKIQESCDRAKELYGELCGLDPVRKNYWLHQQRFAENLLQKQTYNAVAN